MNKTKGVHAPIAVGNNYFTQLKKQILLPISNKVNKELVPKLNLTNDATPFDAFNSFFDTINRSLNSLTMQKIVDKLANDFVNEINKRNYAANKLIFGIDILNGDTELNSVIGSSVMESVKLIKDLGISYSSSIQEEVLNAINSGTRSSALADKLEHLLGVNTSRAKLIARDQTSKVNGALSSYRQQGAGFNYFQWLDSGDIGVRDEHSEFAKRITEYGKGIYRWDNPPINSKGKPVLPSEDVQCRCIAIPVSDATVEANKQSGKVSK